MNHIRYIHNFILNARSYKDKKVISKGYPAIIALEPTNHCAMKCIMCPRKEMNRKLGFMDFELFKKIIDQTNGYTNMISLELFGDAFLHPNIEKMINYLYKKKIISQISTNAMSLSDRVIDKILNSELDVLLIALDGIDNKTYKKYRGDFADYNKAISQVNKLLSRKVEKNKRKPLIEIRMIGMPGLREHFKDYKKTWQKPGMDKVSMSEFHTFGGLVKEIDGKTSKDTKWYNKGICYKPWQGLHIMWDGRVCPCCFDYDGKYIIGDLNKQTLEEVWNSKKMQKLRKQCITNNFKSNILCATCTEKKIPKITRFFPFDSFLFKNIIHYTYQRNQNKIILKELKKFWDRSK